MIAVGEGHSCARMATFLLKTKIPALRVDLTKWDGRTNVLLHDAAEESSFSLI